MLANCSQACRLCYVHLRDDRSPAPSITIPLTFVGRNRYTYDTVLFYLNTEVQRVCIHLSCNGVSDTGIGRVGITHECTDREPDTKGNRRFSHRKYIEWVLSLWRISKTIKTCNAAQIRPQNTHYLFCFCVIYHSILSFRIRLLCRIDKHWQPNLMIS